MDKEEDVSKFPHPLNVEIDEQVPVRKVGVEMGADGTPVAKVKTVMETQRVKYVHVPKVKYRCKDGEHVFRPYHARKWLFACTICPFVRKVFPTTYRFEQSTGKLIHRITGRAI